MRHRLVVAALLLILAAVVGCSDNSTPQADSTTIEETTAAPTAARRPRARRLSWWGPGTGHKPVRRCWPRSKKRALRNRTATGCRGTSTAASPGRLRATCAKGPRGPLEHDHFFTAAGAFGSHDENGEEVDGGDYLVVDEDTVSFPSHAAEFGYDGDLAVGYAINGDVATFDVDLPESCADKCADAYAWALSAFASGPVGAGRGAVELHGANTARHTSRVPPRRLTRAC